MSGQSTVKRTSSLLCDDELERLEETCVLWFEHPVGDRLTKSGSEDLGKRKRKGKERKDETRQFRFPSLPLLPLRQINEDDPPPHSPHEDR